MSSITEQLVLTDIEKQGLDKMRELNQEFLAKNKCSNEVRQFLSKAHSDADLMLLYLRARKYRPEHAWETLKKRAEVRFDHYPEVFVPKPAAFHEELQKIGLWGLLKSTDRFGRRVICVRCSKWDINFLDITDFTNCFIQFIEKLLLDDNALDNGVVLVGNAEGMGLEFVKHLGPKIVLRFFYCLWFTCPLKLKEINALSMPFYFSFVYELIKPVLPKKLRKRFTLSTSNNFTSLHAIIDKRVLPLYLGGTLDNNDAFEFVKF